MDRTPWQELELARAHAAQVAENTARLAHSYHEVTTRTVGSQEMPHTKVIEFDCTFVDKPYISYGYELDQDDGDDLLDTRFPRANGFVYQWQQNKHDMYIGCWVAMVVDTIGGGITTIEADPAYTVRHNFIFSGVAIKDLPEHLFDN